MADENTQQDNIEKNIDIAIEAQDGKPAPTEATDTATTDGTTPQPKDDKEQQPKDGASGTGDSATQPKPVEEGKKDKEPAHGPKDLVTPEGTFKAGMERRLYEGREAARQQFAAERRVTDDLRNQLREANARAETVQQSIQSVHGVEPKTLALGVKIVTDLQRDPVGAIKKLLAEATAQGYNVEDIAAGVDMAAVTRLIDERIPKKEDTTQSDAQIASDAIAEANTFFSSFPDAKPHDKLLASMLRDHPDLSLQDAYFLAKNGFVEKGYDWNLSLEDNLKTSGDPNANQQQPQIDPNKRPLPNGGNAANSEIKTADVVTLAPEDMDTGDIVKQAMREAGLNI